MTGKMGCSHKCDGQKPRETAVCTCPFSLRNGTAWLGISRAEQEQLLHLTKRCRRRLTAYAPVSLRLPAAPERQR